MKDGRKKMHLWKIALKFLLMAFMCLSLLDGITMKAEAAKKPAPTSVKLSQTKLTLTVGKTKQLTCKIKPARANKKLTWSSSNSAVAKVSSKGVVKGIKAGTATITVKAAANKKKATCKVTVTKPKTLTISANIRFWNYTGKQIDELYFEDSSATDYGDEYLETRGIRYWSKNKYINVPLKFKTSTSLDFYIRCSDNTEYEAKGLSLSKATANNTRIDLTLSDVVLKVNNKKITSVPFEKQSTDPVETPAVTSVKLDQTTLTLDVGATQQLTGTVYPEGASDKVTWTTSNSSVATVSEYGVVTGIKAGTATITVKTVDGDKTASCEVTVKETPTVSTEPDAADLVPGNKNFSNIKIDNIKKNGNYLVGFDVSYKTATSIASAPGRVSLNTQVFRKSYSDNSYGDFTDLGKYAKTHSYKTFPTTPDDCGFVTWNAPFAKGNSAYYDGTETFKRSGLGETQKLTVVFPENTILLNTEKTYYVYLWTNYNKKVYPDALLYTFTTNKGDFVPEGTASGSTAISDADWDALQNNYAALVNAYNEVAKLYNSEQIKANKDIEALMTQAKSLIEEMGEIKREDLTASQGQELNEAMKNIAEALLKIIESMEVNPTT